jgi:DNA polymerase I-like protein with 3'-5' exonuclease and polymerase domains
MPTSGPIPAEIAIVCDYPEYGGFNIKLVLESLERLGITGASCFITTITELPPPKGDDGQPDIDLWIKTRKTCPGPGWVWHSGCWISEELSTGFERVERQLSEVSPKLIIALGKAPLLLTTGKHAIDSWRGSRLTSGSLPCPVIPTFHPRRLSRNPEVRFILEMDLKRAYNVYTGKQLPKAYSFQIAPSMDNATKTLVGLLDRAEKQPITLSGDLETRAGHIACFGIAWSDTEAICIPHLTIHETNPFYWNAEDEAILVSLYVQLFTHPNITWTGQNFSYDCQYFWRHWGVVPLKVYDTMIGHHALHSNIKKGLDFLSSMYAHDHIYWKDEIKDWDPTIGEKQYWEYNCKDACITFEITKEIQAAALDRQPPPMGEPDRSITPAFAHTEFQQQMFFPVLRMMNRGIRWDQATRKKWQTELLTVVFDRQQLLNWVVGYEINAKSPKQLLDLFYTQLKIPGIKALGKETLSTNSPTLALIAEKHPILAPLCQLITELRSLGVFQSNFLAAETDIDGRMRTSFNIAGPITYRFSSRENAFYSGLNMQNIPVQVKEKIKGVGNYVQLPNIRELALADQGKTFFDIDLDRADMQVVAREAGDANFIEALAKGIDLHCMSAAEIFGIKGIPVEELTESHPNYADHRARIGKPNRDKTKNGGHACNYGVGDYKLAQTLGITRLEAGAFKARWFGMFPGIRAWHVRTAELVSKQGYIENKFGARLYNFGRFDLPEFLGWLPQSTVSGVINRALVRIDEAQQRGETSIELLIQVHDSLAGQFDTAKRIEEIANLKRLASIVVPYDNPLIIPVGVKTSTVSWGACK